MDTPDEFLISLKSSRAVSSQTLLQLQLYKYQKCRTYGTSRSTPFVASLAGRGSDEVRTGLRVVRKPFAQLKVMEHGDKRNAVIPCYRYICCKCISRAANAASRMWYTKLSKYIYVYVYVHVYVNVRT